MPWKTSFWNWAGSWGVLLGTNPFPVPSFLFVGNRFHSALDLTRVPKCRFKQYLIREQGNAEAREQESRSTVAAMGAEAQSPSPQGICDDVWVLLQELRPSARQNLRTWGRPPGFQEAKPCHLTTNQSAKSHTPCRASPQILPIKTSPWKPSGTLGVLNMSRLFSWLGPARNLLCSKTPVFFGLTTMGHTN